MKYFRAMICCILSFFLFFSLSGCVDEEPTPSIPVVTTAPTEVLTEIDWTMYGTWITPDGKTGEETELTILGMLIWTDIKDTLIVDIRFPDSFRYLYQPLTEFTSQNRQTLDLPYLVCPHFSYNQVTNDAVWAYLALCPEKEYMIFRWEESQDRYLVASTNPDADPQEILDYFQGFIDAYIKE